ncbi:MAG TPA: prolyl oligopeptidase family serine peptidase [Gammaproteobacteria bacterium]|nr:prolyl oligopeptidase family serine peptidase [Gammaproteobacteria bacterium]
MRIVLAFLTSSLVSIIAFANAVPPMATVGAAQQAARGVTKGGYPAARRADTVDDYHGVKMPAPYEWMEDINSPGVAKWVAAENKLTFSYLDRIPERPWMQQRLKALWNYEKVTTPYRIGGKLFFTRNTGLQNQAEVYMQDPKDPAPKLVMDPNALSPDGSVALLSWAPSTGARYFAYGLSQGGSDWEELHVRDLDTGKDTADDIKWVKFSAASWTNDDKGFFYSRYPAPAEGKAIASQVKDQTLYYHVLGTPQSADKLIYARPDLPDWIVGGSVSEDGRYLYIVLSNGNDAQNELYYADLGDPKQPDISATIKPLFTANDAQYQPLDDEGDTLFLQTSKDAPNRKVVSFKFEAPDPKHWKTVVPESKNTIDSSFLVGGEIAVSYLVDAKSQVDLYSTDGQLKRQLKLPDLGTVAGLSGRNDTPELFYSFTSYLYPTSVFRLDMHDGSTSTFFKPKVPFDASPYETRQVFYTSRDGTKVPMFIVAKKGLKLDGKNPTLLYAYGGFDISITPSFNPILPVWLELGGVYAVPNLRGGGEYGETWHSAGMFGKKQNVFDDYAWAAKYLVAQHYTTVKQLGISGYSNGGLLVGASITESPQLFGAAYGGAGVMDMLRYQKFSGGNLWVSEYGSSDDPKAFQWLRAYSPVQNVKPGTCYPPTLLTTADHDDRVVPSHTYKFAAALQAAQTCDNPILVRIETKTSHNYMPTDKRIAQTADVWAFLAYNLGIAAAPRH